MQQQGITEDQIIKSLQDRGVPYKEISESLSQSKIKAAVEEPPSEPAIQEQEIIPATSQAVPTAPTAQAPPPQPSSPETIPGMQRSMLQSSPEESPQITQEYTPPTQIPQPGGYVGEEGPYGGQYEYQPYEYAATGAISPDTITEIAEQVASEKIMEIRKSLEKVIDFRTTIEAKTESIDERLKRIEQIIGTLQSSVLRKVGDYVTNIEDIKKELIETQKSFSKFIPQTRKHKSRTTHHKKAHKKTSHKRKK